MMGDFIQIRISKSLLARTAQYMQELAVYRRGVIEPVNENETENWYALEGVKKLEWDARELGFYAESNPAQKPTEDEQIEAMKALIAELEKEGLPRDWRYGNAADDLRAMFREAMNQREKAFKSWAALVDNQRVGLRALRLLANSVLQQGTHSRKNARMYALIDILDNVLADLMGIDVDHPGFYDSWNDDRNGSWEMRRVLAEKRQLELQLEAFTAKKDATPDAEEDDADGRGA